MARRKATGVPPALWAGLVLLALVGGAAGAWWYHRRTEAEAEPETEPEAETELTAFGVAETERLAGPGLRTRPGEVT